MSFKKIKLAILGSTGSIGTTSLKIINKYKNYFNVELLACDKNKKIILSQIKKFLPKYVIIKNKQNFDYLKKIKFKKKIKFFQNLNDFNKQNKIKFDKVILGISSIEGLEYAFSFIKFSKAILLANKETIVCGGKFFLRKAKKANCKIVSIDSEHYCLNECIEIFGLKNIKKFYITASGGPFLNKNKKQIMKINPNIAAKHPNWKMGKKISIDSATMANKGLEIIEACNLFNIKSENIMIKIHKESKVHCGVVLNNNLIFLVAHNTSMTIPIENSLIHNKKNLIEKNFFFNKKNFLFSFDESSLKNFKMVSLAYKALKYGDRACIFYNVVNDQLVQLYLNKQIFFYEIYSKLNKVMNNKKLFKYFKKKITKLSDIYETIQFAKSFQKLY